MNPRVATVARVLSSESVAVVGELLGLFLSIKRFIDEGVRNGTAISDCQGALGELFKTRALDFHPFRNTQQHCALLRYYSWAVLGPDGTALAWYPGHSEGREVDPEMQGVQEAQIETDRLAGMGQEPDMDPIHTTAVHTFDFPFVLVTEAGKRAQGTLAQMVGRRRRDPSFHMQRQQTHRERPHGVSWVDLPTSLFYLPTTYTPYNSKKAWPSKLRSKYDVATDREALLQNTMLARAAINGGDSHLTAMRLDMLGGLTELATGMTSIAPDKRQRAACPFCEAKPEDSLQHLTWNCKSDGHATATNGAIDAEKVVERIRERFRSGMIAAMLDTGCPLTLAATKREADAKEGKVKAARTNRTTAREERERKEATMVSYNVIRAIAKAKVRAKLQHQPAHLWFQGKERAVESDRARLRLAKAGGLQRTAATKAQAVIIERLASTVEDERRAWAGRKGDNDVMPTYVNTPAKVSPALDCPDKGEEIGEVETALSEAVLFAQALACAFRGDIVSVAARTPQESDKWAGNTWTDLAPDRRMRGGGRKRISTELATLRYGGLVDCSASWTEARQMRTAAREKGHPLLYIAITGPVPPTAMVGHALESGEWLLMESGNASAVHCYTMYVPGPQQAATNGTKCIPRVIRQWKHMRRGTDEGARPDMKTPHELRLRLAKSIVAYHERTGSEVWWQHSLTGAEGQCRGVGLISNETHRELQPHMTKRAFAQLYASYHWQLGVLVSSVVSCRAAVADLVTKSEQGAADGALTERMRQFIRAPPPTRPLRRGSYAWPGTDRAKGGLPACSTCSGKGSVTSKRKNQPSCDVTCPTCQGTMTWTAMGSPEEENDEELPLRGPTTRKVCRHLPPRRALIEVLRQLGREWSAAVQKNRHPHGIIGPGTCDNCSKALVSDQGTEHGTLLVDGRVLCGPCAAEWTKQVQERLMLDRGEECMYLPMKNGPRRKCCVKCWSRNPEAVADLGRELRQIATNHLLGQLLRRPPGSFKRALINEVEAMWAGSPATEVFGVPASLLWQLSSWLQRHASHWMTAAPHLADASRRVDFRKPSWLALIGAVPPIELESRTARGHRNLHSETVRGTEGLETARGLANLRVTLKRHNNVALPKAKAQLPAVSVLIGLDAKRDSLPLAEPADSHVTDSEQAECKKCEDVKGDAFAATIGKELYHCLACNTWLHEDCMSRHEWDTITLHDHLERCQQQGEPALDDLDQEKADKLRQYHKEMELEEGATSFHHGGVRDVRPADSSR
jgi:hypothetical protein